ncbi:MAG TPA: inorganic phosphate transporter [Burkholderiaceae bacterium]|nr:inorganic phosphate transporter [Burkholderiaceae bacterium]
MLTALLALALAFAFVQAFRDAPLSLASLVTGGGLHPLHAIVWAAAFNLLAALVFGLQVAATTAFGIVDPAQADRDVIFGALAGGLAWLAISRWIGIAASASHALIGGLLGASVASGGAAAILAAGTLPFVAFIVVAPALAFLLGALLMVGVSWLFFRVEPRRVDGWFRRLQLVSSALYALGYAGNNAQKTMAVIWLLLIGAGLAGAAALPAWVVWASHAAIALGTLAGGRRIVRQMGQRITRLRPAGGFCAESGAAAAVSLATLMGVPVSSTQTLAGALVGVGSANTVSAVRWSIAGDFVRAALLTIPAAAVLAALGWRLGRLMS